MGLTGCTNGEIPRFWMGNFSKARIRIFDIQKRIHAIDSQECNWNVTS
jgi:hypothetical protein